MYSPHVVQTGKGYVLEIRNGVNGRIEYKSEPVETLESIQRLVIDWTYGRVGQTLEQGVAETRKMLRRGVRA